jgi:hypothetical protein
VKNQHRSQMQVSRRASPTAQKPCLAMIWGCGVGLSRWLSPVSLSRCLALALGSVASLCPLVYSVLLTIQLYPNAKALQASSAVVTFG